MTDYRDVTTLLGYIQRHIKAPKTRENKFGNYKYRNCEDILDAIKPHLADGAALTVTDDIHLVGARFYIKAVATLKYKGATEQATAYARECDTKKGMDDAQLTTSTSSYARKAALNGLLMIDDAKDADAQEPSREEKKEIYVKANNFKNQINQSISVDNLVTWHQINEKAIEELPVEQIQDIMMYYDSRLSHLQKGNLEPLPYHYNGVSEQDVWCQKAKLEIASCMTIEQLEKWEIKNKGYLKGLESKKNAQGVSRASRMTEIVGSRYKEIQNQPNTILGA
jgi:hypothetical protein